MPSFSRRVCDARVPAWWAFGWLAGRKGWGCRVEGVSVDGEDGFYRALRWKGQSDRAAALVLFFPSTHFWSDLTARCKPVACGSRVVKCAKKCTFALALPWEKRMMGRPKCLFYCGGGSLSSANGKCLQWIRSRLGRKDARRRDPRLREGCGVKGWCQVFYMVMATIRR